MAYSDNLSSISPPSTPKVDELEEAINGYILDPNRYPNGAAGLKTTQDGRFVLIPQPSDSVADPLNWSSRKKLINLVIMAYIAFLADYTGSTAIIPVIPQAIEWNLSEQSAQRAIVGGGIFYIGASGLIFVGLANYVGRLPVTVVFQAIFLGTCAWCAAATSFRSYVAARIVNSLFCSAGQGGAMVWIRDLYCFHEHPRVINYVEMGIIVSPYLGPLIKAFIIGATTWRWAFWLCITQAGIAFVLAFFMDETIFDRTVPRTKETPVWQNNPARWQYILGIEQARTVPHRSFTESIMRPLLAIVKLPILLINIYHFLNFAWVIGVNTTVSIWLTSYYAFTPRDIGFFYFFSLVGPLVGWFVGQQYAKRHNGIIDPEVRLYIAYPATLLLFGAVLILGFALQYHWHYMVLAVLCALQTVGIMVVTTAINAYPVDAYPEGSGEVGAWISATRSWSGFMATYIQIEWVTSAGLRKAFGAQAGITGASILILIVLQVFGKRMRKAQGRIVFREQSKKQ